MPGQSNTIEGTKRVAFIIEIRLVVNDNNASRVEALVHQLDPFGERRAVHVVDGTEGLAHDVLKKIVPQC